jgi:hypothetical protein
MTGAAKGGPERIRRRCSERTTRVTTGLAPARARTKYSATFIGAGARAISRSDPEMFSVKLEVKIELGRLTALAVALAAFFG